jgi:hypothetical protein
MGTWVKIILAWLAVSWVAAGQTTLNMSEDLVGLGIATSNMVPNQPSLDAGPLFFRAVIYARNHQISRVVADTGAYYFLSLQDSGAHVAWDKLSNLTIDLQGSDLYFSHPLVNGMVITNSTNIVVENFTVDYAPLPFTQVRVVSVNPAQQSIQFAVDGNWQNPSALNAVFATIPNEYGVGVEVHIFRNGRPAPGVTRMYANNPVGSTQFTATPDPGVNPSVLFAQIRPGDIAFLGMRGTFGGPVSTLYCTGCTFRNITAYSGNESFGAGFTQSSLFERLYTIPRPGTDRLAGGFLGLVLTGMGANNAVRLNRVIRSMDDGIEYNGLYIGTIKSQTDNRTFVVEGSLTSLLSYGNSVPGGAGVAFQRLSDGAILASAVTASAVAPPYSGQPYEVTFTFDRDLPAAIVGSLMYGTDPGFRGGNSVIERNALEEETDCCAGIATGGTLNSVLTGNYVQRAAMSALAAGNAVQPGNINLPPSVNLTISNNVVDSANWIRTAYPLSQLGSILIDGTNAPRLLTTSPQQNISVTNNFIADSGSAATWVGNTTNGSASGNYFLNSNNNAAVESAVSFFGPSTQPLVLQSSQNILTSNNTIDQTSGRMWVTDRQYRELAAYGPGTLVRLNAYGLGSFFPAPSVTLTDADGNTTALTIQSATAHAIDVQIPASAGLGGAYLTLTSGGAKYFGTLFLDAVDNIPSLNGCTYEVSLSSAAIGAGAGTLPILVVTQAGCPYQISSTDAFVKPGAGGSGTGVVSASFSANSGQDRTTTIEVAGQPLAVKQTSQSNTTTSVKILPQFAFGGGWYSALYFTTTGAGAASFPVSFIGNDGNPLIVPAVGGSTAIVNLAARGTAIIEAPNVGDLTQGYASAALPPGVTGYAVFRQSVAGRPDQEAVVPLAATSATTATLIWDDTVLITSVAVVGLSPAGSTVTVTARDLSGAILGTGTMMVAANGKQAIALRDVPGLSGIAGKRGSADFSVTSGNVAILGIRFGGSAFTDIPTAGVSGQAAILPQFAFGDGWYTALYFTTTGSGSASFPVNFIGNDGKALNVPALGGSSTTVNLAARGTAIVEAPNVGSLTQGYVAAALPAGVSGYAVFRQSVAGRPDQEAVVPLSGSSTTTSTLIWDDTAFTTSVAIVGLSSTTSTVSITVRDEGGNLIGTGTVNVPPNGKVATVLHDVTGLNGMLGRRGSADFTVTSGNAAVLGIRFGGSAFTDIPTTDK